MSMMQYLRLLGVVGPIVLLLALGLALTLRSGLVDAARGQRARMAVANLSQTVLALAACLLGLVAVQHVVGFHMGLVW